MNNQRDINKTIARAILPIVAFFAMAAAVCPTSKEGSVPCCSTITADPGTSIVWPESNPPVYYQCIQISCDNKDKKPQRCNGPMSATVRCQELNDWVIKSYKRLTKNGSDCVLPVVGNPKPVWVECPSTTSPQDATCDEKG